MWWDIIKNQIASTKGKTFQLDFNQPMIEEEEEDCKKRYQSVVNKISNLNFAGLKKEAKNDEWMIDGLKSFDFIEEEFYEEKKLRPDVETYTLFSDKIPEEIYCNAIEQYEKTRYGGSELDNYGEYRVLTEKNRIGSSSGTYEWHNYKVETNEISIHLKDKLVQGPVATIYIRHRIFFKGRYGEEERRNMKLDDRVEQTIRGALVF